MDSLELAQALIARPSITPQDAGCQQLISKLLSTAGFHCEALNNGKVSNLWATIGSGAPLFVFAGHTDVVPPGSLSDWKSPPFEPTIQNGLLYGRGATDMKGALAAMISAGIQFTQQCSPFKGSLGFLITSDEEGPGIGGTERVIEILTQRGVNIDYALVGEASSENRLGDQIRIGRRGSLHGKLTIQGQQGHVAYPHLNKNPIHTCLVALHHLANQRWDEGNADFPATTLQMTNIHSGTGALNVIPGELELCFNFRYSTAIEVTELKDRCKQIFDQIGLDYHLAWTSGAKPFLSKGGKLRQTVLDILKNHHGRSVISSTGGGTSDARFIAPTGAEVIELGVLHQSAHQVNEHVSLDDLKNLTHIYYEILNNLLSDDGRLFSSHQDD